MQETDRSLRPRVGPWPDMVLGKTSTQTAARQKTLKRKGRDDTVRWPRWKTVAFVLVVCGGFWAGLIWLVIALFT